MFGYVKVFQPEMKMREFEQYRGVYCALCKTLRRRYGPVIAWSLNYDFAFLALFRMAQSPECAGFRQGRCPYHPLRRRRLCCGEHAELDFSADAAVLLTYYKLRDTVADGGFFARCGARAALLFFGPARKKAARLRPAAAEQIADCMRRQAETEAARTPSADAAADPTGRMLAYLASDGAPEATRAARERFGYCLGRWIYLTDALDDWERDRAGGAYNPLLLRDPGADPDAVRAAAQASLNASRAECAEAYRSCTVLRFDGILSNVLEWGMPAVQEQVMKKEKRI